MFHVEMRTGIDQVRAYNLTDEEVQNTFILPLRADRLFTYEEMEWDPRAVKLRVLEGPRLRPDQIGFGRGWANAERSSTDVTAKLVAQVREAAPDQDVRLALKDRLLGRLFAGPLPLAEIPVLAEDLMAGDRASQHLAVAETAVWELLHQERAVLLSDDFEVPQEGWEELVLSPRSWFGESSVQLGPVS